MLIKKIRAQMLSIPEVSSWPEIVDLINEEVDTTSKPCWEYSVIACEAVGGTEDLALLGATAIFSMLYSIHLIDDLLDEDPEGVHHQLGASRTANAALALQAASSILIEKSDLNADRRAAIHHGLAQAALGTAYGQHLDLGALGTEIDYWRVVEAKTPPLFGTALYVGALLGGASLETGKQLLRLGFILGKCIQISDDLRDAMETPARPDWHRRWNNLAILYAMTADHQGRSRFQRLLSRIEEPPALLEAQKILVRSGAASYCIYHMLNLHRSASEHLQTISLKVSEPLEELLDHLEKPMQGILKSIGVAPPADLLGSER